MQQRILSLDLIRGVALLGIYIINITLFAYDEASLVAFFTQLETPATTLYQAMNQILVFLISLFFNQKMMSLFSMLFGASILLITQKRDAQGESPMLLHYRRNFWLLVIGVMHVLVWYGDILFTYAIAAFVIYPARKLRYSRLILLAIPVYLLSILFVGPASQAVYYDVDPLFPITSELVTNNLLFIEYFLLSVANMLVGMALFKSGLMIGKYSTGSYKRITAASLSFGLIFFLLQLTAIASGYLLDLNTPSAVFMAIGYIAIINLWNVSKKLPALQLRLQAVGRTALSNYILQTLVSVVVFYNAFLGLREYSLDVFQQVLVVLAMWILQLTISHRWLKKFRYGPLEWGWRSLYYWRRQPMRR